MERANPGANRATFALIWRSELEGVCRLRMSEQCAEKSLKRLEDAREAIPPRLSEVLMRGAAVFGAEVLVSFTG
jgi:hypothetical protein